MPLDLWDYHMEIELLWSGPFVFVPQPSLECVFDQTDTSQAGLYLWTVEIDDAYLINYVGETGRDLWSRLVENVAWSFGGREGCVLNPQEFRKGRIVNYATFSFSEFLADHRRLSSVILEVYQSYRVFVAPTSVSNDQRKFIEAGIIRTLRESGGTIAEFLCNTRLIGPSPEPLSARFVTRQRFHGLGERIQC